jgi:Fe-S-cluster containining protein
MRYRIRELMIKPTNICLKCPDKVHCCKFKAKGFVFIGPKDAINICKKYRINDFLELRKLSKKTVSSLKHEPKYSEGYLRYSQLKDGRLPVLKTQKNGDCIFLKKGKCIIYKDRPLICRIYPYWFYNGEKMHIIEHNPGCKCKLLKQKEGKADVSSKERTSFKKLSKSIIEENKFYKRNIVSFISQF